MEGVAKLAIGLIFVAVFIQFIKGGPEGAKAWFRAKFLGEVA